MQKTLTEWMPDVDELEDPFVAEGGNLVYKCQHKFIIKIQEKPELVQTLKDTECLMVKIIVEYEHDSPKNIRIQLTSDSQIYFNFVFECNDWEFKRIKANQNFFIEFREYPEVILKNFQKLNQSNQYFGIFTIFSETEGKLNIIRKSQFKDDTIMEFDFVKAPQEQIKKSIQYRYDLMKKIYEQLYLKYDSVGEIIRQKNPSLMIQITKMLKKKNDK